MGRLERGMAALCTVAAALVGCGDEGPMDLPTALEFALVQFDGADVPLSTPTGAAIVAGSFTLRSDGGCRRSLSYRISPAADVTESVWTCSWTGNSSDVSIAWSFGQINAAALVGTRLTVVVQTGAVCVTTPCPSEWTEVYEQLD